MEEVPQNNATSCCGTCGCAAVASVRARLDDLSAELIAERTLIRSKVSSYGSPLNFVMPGTVLKNWTAFDTVLRDAGVRGEVLCTSKPNKSKAILAALSTHNVAVDVSSEGALRNALECGIRPTRIQCSGPKSEQYLASALHKGATVSVDNLDELSQLIELAKSDTSIPNPTILLRICGFRSDKSKFSPSDAPFGIRMERVEEALSLIKAHEAHVSFKGVHFHLLSGEKEERLVAFENALQVIQSALSRGLTPTVINIGGGFKIQYAANLEEWQRFQSYHRASVLGKVAPITWDGSGLGLRAENGRVMGVPAYADHCPTETGPVALRNFLAQRSSFFDGCTVRELLRDMMLELRVEPGRALLDGAGFTVADVAAVKESAAGVPLLMLNMNHTNLLSREQKLLTQPLFIAQGERAQSTKSYFVFGNLCIASDLIQYQKVYPGFEPRRGDLLIFANTAAYHMDFAEAEILHQPIAKKIAIFKRKNDIVCCSDELVHASDIPSLMEL